MPQKTFFSCEWFSTGTYRQCLSEIQSVRRLYTVEHRPLWDADAPGILHWSQYADDTRVLRRERTEPLWLLGHSMGGGISLMLAARAPELLRCHPSRPCCFLFALLAVRESRILVVAG